MNRSTITPHRRRRSVHAFVALAAAIAAFAVPSAGNAAHTRTLDVTPENGTSIAGVAVTLTATVDSPADVTSGAIEIDFEIEGGPNDVAGAGNAAGNTPGSPDLTCTILLGASSCTAQYLPSTNNLDQVRGWIHHTGADRATEPDADEGVNETLAPGATGEADATDVVQNLVTGGLSANVLDCDDEDADDGEDSATDPTTGADEDTHETYTCKVTVNGTGVPNIVVDAENLTAGVNDADAGKVAPPDHTCTTGAQGTCQITVPTSTGTLAAGTATYCFWIDSNNDEAVDDTSPNNGSDCDEAFDEEENVDATDTARVAWQTRTVASIDILNEDDSRILPAQTSHTVNLKAIDQFGGGVGGVPIDLYVIGGPNAESGSTASRGCTSAGDGTCSVTYSSGGANGVDKFCAWRDLNPADLYAPAGGAGDGGACATEPEAPDTDGGDAFTDRGQVTWSGGASVAAQLEVTPETAPGGTVAEGTHYGLTATVKDENENPMSGKTVNFEIIGAGDPDSADTPGTPDRTCTTGATGTCSLEGDPGAIGSATTFTSAVGGTSTVRSWVAGTTADASEGPDAGGSPNEPAGGTDVPGGTVEPDTTDVVAVRWGKLATTLTAILSGTTTVGTYGFDPTITGALEDDEGNPLAGVSVSVYRRTVGTTPLQALGMRTTDDDGEFSFTDSNPPYSYDYFVKFGGDGEHHPSSSAAVRVAIRPGVIFNVSPTSLPRNRPAQLSGAIIPGHPGQKVHLQMFDGNAKVWRYLRTVTLDGNSRYQFSYTKNAAGMLLFRIAYPTQHADHAWNVSRNMAIYWT